jgi:DNA-binding transcriptional LysR family regulator
MPKIALRTFSVHIRSNLVTSRPFIATLPKSAARFYADRFSLKVLQVDLPARPWPVVLLTLKDRSLSPMVDRFIEHLCKWYPTYALIDRYVQNWPTAAVTLDRVGSTAIQDTADQIGFRR